MAFQAPQRTSPGVTTVQGTMKAFPAGPLSSATGRVFGQRGWAQDVRIGRALVSARGRPRNSFAQRPPLRGRLKPPGNLRHHNQMVTSLQQISSTMGAIAVIPSGSEPPY